MRIFSQLNIAVLILAVFFLPVSLNLNNICLSVFLGLSVIRFFLDKKQFKEAFNKKNIILLVLFSIPFLLNALGLIYTDEVSKGLDYTIRAAPFFALPLIAFFDPKLFSKHYKHLGYALVLGCLFVAVYSWSFSINELLSNKKPIKELFGPLYSHHNLVKSLELHSAYVSICIYTAIGFMVMQYRAIKDVKLRVALIVLMLILIAFMLHLLSRNAILYFLLASFIYLISIRKWKVLIAGFLVLATIGTIAYNVKHNYLRDRLFKNLNFFEKETKFSKKDDRFDRLAASYEVFKNKPLIGYGTAAESKYRKEVYKRNKDRVAFENNYNAHNQFFEYLSTYGIIGGIGFLLFFGNIFLILFRVRNPFFTYTFLGIFTATITESIFERTQGVVYTSILIALIYSYIVEKRESTKNVV